MLQIAKESIKSAQDLAQFYANQGRVPKEFEVEDMVYLKIPKESRGIYKGRCSKLSPRFCGPFKILKKINQVAYKLDLPEFTRIHLVFYISKLKSWIGDKDALASMEDLKCLEDLSELSPARPLRVVDVRQKHLRNRMVSEYLIRWKGKSSDEDIWENKEELRQRFPDFVPRTNP